MHEALWICCILAVLTIFFRKFFFSGMIPINSEWLLQNFYPWKGIGIGHFLTGYPNDFDPVLAIYPFKYQAIEMMRHGVLPLWNPYILCGAPLWGNNFATPLNPLNVIFFLKGFPQGWALFLFAQFAVAGIGTYLYCRELGMVRAGSVIASIAFMLNVAFMLLYQTVSYLGVFSWIPLALLLIERTIRTRSRLYALWSGIVLAFFFWSGIVQLAVYASLFSLVYLVFRVAQACLREPQHGRTFAALGLLTVAAAVLFSLPELVIQATLIANSTRTPGRYGLTVMYPQMLITYISPFFYGTKFDGWDIGYGTYIFNRGLFRLSPPYIGILPLFLACFGYVTRKDADRFFYMFFSFGILAALFLLGFPLVHKPLLRLIPFLCSVDHYRLTTLYAFSISVMAGWGYHGIVSARSQSRLMCYLPFALATSVMALFGLLDLSSRFSSQSVAGFMTALQKALPRALFDGSHSLKNISLFTDYLRFLRGSRPSIFLRPEVFWPIALSITSAILIAATVLIKRRNIIGVGMVVVLAADLLGYGYAGQTYSRAISVYPKTPAVKYLRNDTSLYRIAGYATPTVPQLGDSFPPDTGMIYGLYDIRGYENLGLPVRYVRFLNGGDPCEIVTDDINSPILSFLNVKYLVSKSRLACIGWEKVYDREVKIYRNPKVLGRAFIAPSVTNVNNEEDALAMMRKAGFDPLKEVMLENPLKMPVPKPESLVPPRIERYSPNEVRIILDGQSQGLLVLTDTYYPGWHVTVDGRACPVECVDGAFRGVVITKGDRRVRFVYRPSWFYEISITCMILLLAMALLSAICFFRKMKRT